MWSRLIREPLLHFLLLGALVFVAYGLVTGGDPADLGNRIEVTAGDIQRLEDAWSKQWRRRPTEAELTNLIAQHVREEVLYREALALGLDQDDTIIRRRLAQKMEFLAQDLSIQREPTEAELEAYFTANREKFAEPARLSFTHVYFSTDDRGVSAATDAALVLAELTAAGVERGPQRGDRFMLQSDYEQIDQRGLAQLFGTAFANDVFQRAPDAWHGPIESGYGLHLVRIAQRTELRVPELAEVRERVRSEYDYERRQQADQEVFERLKARYEIVIEYPAPPGTVRVSTASEEEPS